MLRTIQKAPGMDKLGVLTTDKGNEFTGAAANVLEGQGVSHRTQDPADPNPMAVLDRAIHTLKRRLAQSLAGKSGPWPSRAAQVVAQYNATFHPAIRDEPEDFNKSGHAVKRFLAEQDNGEKLSHNQELLEKRKAKLEAEGGYRVPMGGVSKLRRSFHQSYSGGVKELEKVQGSMVKDKTREKHDMNRVMAVNVFSVRADDGLKGNNMRIDTHKDILMPMMTQPFAFLDAGGRISTGAAAEELKRGMGAEYRNILRRACFAQLARAVALSTKSSR